MDISISVSKIFTIKRKKRIFGCLFNKTVGVVKVERPSLKFFALLKDIGTCEHKVQSR